MEELAEKVEEIETYLENDSFWPRSPERRLLAWSLAFNGLGGALLAAYQLGNLSPSLAIFALVAHAVGLAFFFSWLRAIRTAWRKLKELKQVTDGLRATSLSAGEESA